jgi:hypothetical protein
MKKIEKKYLKKTKHLLLSSNMIRNAFLRLLPPSCPSSELYAARMQTPRRYLSKEDFVSFVAFLVSIKKHTPDA